MYCVVHSKYTLFKCPEDVDVKYIGIRVFKNIKLAKMYLKKRYDKLEKEVLRKDKEGTIFLIRPFHKDINGTWASVSYVERNRNWDDIDYESTEEMVHLVKVPGIRYGSDVIKLKKIKN